MSMSAGLLLEVWEVIQDHLPNNKREDMARKLVHIFSEHGMDRDDFMNIKGEDDNIDSAIDSVYTGEEEEPDLDYEDEYDN